MKKKLQIEDNRNKLAYINTYWYLKVTVRVKCLSVASWMPGFLMNSMWKYTGHFVRQLRDYFLLEECSVELHFLYVVYDLKGIAQPSLLKCLPLLFSCISAYVLVSVCDLFYSPRLQLLIILCCFEFWCDFVLNIS